MKTIRHLVELFAPNYYNISLDLTKRKMRIYTGEVVITGKLLQNANSINVHSKDADILETKINGEQAAFKQDGDELIITKQNLKPGDYTINIKFSAKITDPMSGIYPCYFLDGDEPKELLMTQLESISAREAFPCIDEPAAKASFSLTLITEPGITRLSNMPIKAELPTGKHITTTFETTPIMSTYLLAFVIGDLKYKETMTKNGIPVRAYATPQNINKLDFAAEHTAKFLDFYDEYFAEPFPLPKCDVVACPDFAAGAMENWGLLTFRESEMLVDKSDCPADHMQRVAQVIAHEAAHQWFGDLVTMKWWDDLWLNESFANWMENYATAHFYPEWQIWEQYSAQQQQIAFARDSLASVQSVQQRVNHPDEIATLFDSAIVYAKGGSLIRMLNEYLGDQVFRDGLRIYMQRHKYKNTTTQDLWQALSEASGKNIKQFMQSWIAQPGHPIVSMQVNGQQAKLTQKRFFANPLQADANDTSLWQIPLLSAEINEKLFKTADLTVGLKPADYYLLNQGGTGFYHVKYDAKNTQKLAEAVKAGKLGTTNRQRLLTDALALNRSGQESSLTTLKLLQNYKDESNYAVWLAISAALGSIKIIINDDENLKPQIRKITAEIYQKQYHQLGWKVKPQEPHFDTLLRSYAIANMAYARDQEVTNKCLELFANAAKPEDIEPDIRSIIYSVAVRENPANTEKLLNWYKTTQNADERLNICAGLTNVRDQEKINQLLNLITTKTVKLQDAFYWFMYLLSNRHARQAAWQWMIDNWQWIKDNYKGDSDYAYFARFPGNSFSTPEELALYKNFFEQKLNEPGLTRTIKQSYETIETKILWRNRDFDKIAAYLKEIR